MAPSASTSEITESKEEISFSKCSGYGKPKLYEIVVKKHGHPVQNDLNRLFEAIDLRYTSGDTSHSHQEGLDIPRKNNALKKTCPIDAFQAPVAGNSESITLKQALRKLCISQASEMAAMKRLSKPTGLSGVSEAGTIKRLYKAVVVHACEAEGDQDKHDMLEISLVPEKPTTETSENITDSCHISSNNSCSKADTSLVHDMASCTLKMRKAKVLDVIAPISMKSGTNISAGAKTRIKRKVKLEKHALSTNVDCELSKQTVTSGINNLPVKNNARKKEKDNQSCLSGSSDRYNDIDRSDSAPMKKPEFEKESTSVSKITGTNSVSCLKNKESSPNKSFSTPSSCSGSKAAGVKLGKNPRSRQKGDYSQSSKSSLGDFSSSTSISDESNQSGSGGFVCRPHMSKDARWIAIHNAELRYGRIGLRNFTLLKRLGCGDIGTVYLAELTGSECLFALKVMDNEFLVSRKKMLRAQTEREILQMLDHPFLPTLYTHFTTDNLSCLVMEYCPGGDLHVLRQKQPGRSFTELAARFYVAEVLLALEYLHMLGVVYRDLKPENILVREDGHIMLSDFDLSLRCSINPILLRSSSLGLAEVANKLSGPCALSSCIDPSCLEPSWVQVSCFTPKTRKAKSDLGTQVSPFPQLVVEPTEARSNSFVGTHEYLAPEIIKGEGHGSSVDWWTFGIFLYELLFGRTPFKGVGNEETLANVVSESLMFPECPTVSFQAIDLIRALLVKEPENRLGSVMGAAEIKRHPFFRGLNWALIRCATPPEVPTPYSFGIPVEVPKKKEGRCLEFMSNGGDAEFELF